MHNIYELIKATMPPNDATATHAYEILPVIITVIIIFRKLKKEESNHVKLTFFRVGYEIELIDYIHCSLTIV